MRRSAPWREPVASIFIAGRQNMRLAYPPVLHKNA
jgi:hypothetical protein